MPSSPRGGPAEYLLLAALVLFCFVLGLGAVPLFDVDEGAFSEATREMLAGGDFITTYLNGEPRFDKPILIYWLQALSVSLLGLDEWALRLPSALAAGGWVLAVYGFSRPRLGAEGALAAAAITATTLAVNIIARAATADALLNLWLVLSMLDIYRYVEDPRPALRNRVFLWIGLAVLTKGPVGILIPFLASLIHFGWAGRWRAWLRTVFHPVGLVICAAVFLPWYVLEYLDQGQAFIDGFLLKHNVGRFSATMEGHGGSLFYYLPATPLVLLPFTGLFLAVLPKARLAAVDPLDRWLWIWFGVVFVVFSLSNTQLPHYILYGATPLFILMARHRAALRSRVLAAAPPLLFFGVLLLLPELLQWQRAQVSNDYLSSLVERAASELDTGFRIALAAALLASVVLIAWRGWSAWRALIAVGLIQVLIVAQVLLPLVGAVQQAPVKALALAARELPQTVVMWRVNMPSFSVYREAVTPRREPRPGEVVFTRVDKLQGLPPHRVLQRRDGLVLALLDP